MTPQADGGQKSADVTANSTADSDFQRLLDTQQHFAPSPEVLAQANVKDYQALYDEAARDLEGFWEKIAQGFTWEKPWTKVLEGQAPDARWFVGGQLNIITNCRPKPMCCPVVASAACATNTEAIAR